MIYVILLTKEHEIPCRQALPRTFCAKHHQCGRLAAVETAAPQREMPRQAGANRRRQFWQNEIPLFLRANQGPVRGPPGLAVERPRQPSSQSTCDAASALRGRQNPPADQLAIPCSIPCSGNANILFRKEQGISRRLFKSLCDFASVSVKTTPKQAELVKFPVIFPVLSSRRGG